MMSKKIIINVNNLLQILSLQLSHFFLDNCFSNFSLLLSLHISIRWGLLYGNLLLMILMLVGLHCWLGRMLICLLIWIMCCVVAMIDILLRGTFSLTCLRVNKSHNFRLLATHFNLMGLIFKL